MTSFEGRAIHRHGVLSICIFSFPHCWFVGRMLTLIELVPDIALILPKLVFKPKWE